MIMSAARKTIPKRSLLAARTKEPGADVEEVDE
jgi:hypothetical protein